MRLRFIPPTCVILLALLIAASSRAAVYWSGPGGDIWNTNSSPYAVDATRPFDVLWTSYSIEGQFHRSSGVVLADVGVAHTPYLFGSTGWSQNVPYRRVRTDGAAGSWAAQYGENDSGTGFRVALDPAGNRLFHIDAGNVIRAYPTETDPAGIPLWTHDGDQTVPGLANLIKVGPDGRLYGHYQGTAALDPSTGSVVWQSAGNPESAFNPGAFWNRGSRVQYVVSGQSFVVAAYDIASPSGSGPIWSYTDEETGFAPPTIDPATGSVYVFRQTRLLKLTPDGARVWQSAHVNDGEWGSQYGALSRDGSTYYFQTGGPDDSGRLYAFRTSDGTIKWSYPTGARSDPMFGGPVVSANNLVFVANGAVAPRDDRIFCIEDQGTPVLRGTFDLRDDGDSGAPWISIGPDGIVYLDCWAQPDTPLLFAFQTTPWNQAPQDFAAAPFYSTARLSWRDGLGGTVAGYLVWRRAEGEPYPEQPTKYVGPRSNFTDYGLIPGATYYYRLATCNGQGFVNSPFAETAVTLDTDPTGYSHHANLELLVAVYTEGWTPEETAYHVAGIQLGLEFFWRNSLTRLNHDVTWMYIDAPLPNSDGDYGPIVNDLRTRGIRDNQYDLLYTIGPGLGPCLGGYTVFESTKASLGIVCGVPYPGKDPSVDYTLTWTFTHELNHAQDILCDAAGAEDMLFNHFPWNYPHPLDGSRHVDWGTHYDGIAALLRLYQGYDDFGSWYNGYIECVDADRDGMPDLDDRVPADEARFGSSSSLADTDGDGLGDLQEYCRYHYRGTDPFNGDTDGDGMGDASDPQPLYSADVQIRRATAPPVIDGARESAWPLLVDGYNYTMNASDFTLRTYALYDSSSLYLAFESTRQLRFMISIDGSGTDGRFESDVRHPDGTTDTYNDDTKPVQFGDSWGDGNHIYTYYGASGAEVWGVGPISGAAAQSAQHGSLYTTEIRIPRHLPHGCGYTWYPPEAPVCDGLRLEPGRIIGLGVTVSNLADSDGNEFSGTWTTLFEPHAYVDFALAGTTEVDGPEVVGLSFTAPNPLRRGDRIMLHGAPGAAVTVSVFDPAGRRVLMATRGTDQSGPWLWSGHDQMGRAIPPGVYFFRAESGAAAATRKVVVLE